MENKLKQILQSIGERFQEKSEKSYAQGGFLTTDLGDDFRIDVDLQKSHITKELHDVLGAVVEYAESLKVKHEHTKICECDAVLCREQQAEDCTYNAALINIITHIKEAMK